MRKTLIAAFVSASVFALPTFAMAQVSLGGAAHAGAGLSPGAGGALRGAGRIDAGAGQALPPLQRQVRHTAGQATRHAGTLTPPARADLDAAASSSTGADAAGADMHAGAGVDAHVDADARPARERAADASRGVGDEVRTTAHDAIDSTHRSAGSVGDAVRQTATESSVGADAKVRAKADEHGH